MERKGTDILKDIAYLQNKLTMPGTLTSVEKGIIELQIKRLEQNMHAMFNDPKPRTKLWVQE